MNQNQRRPELSRNKLLSFFNRLLTAIVLVMLGSAESAPARRSGTPSSRAEPARGPGHFRRCRVESGCRRMGSFRAGVITPRLTLPRCDLVRLRRCGGSTPIPWPDPGWVIGPRGGTRVGWLPQAGSTRSRRVASRSSAKWPSTPRSERPRDDPMFATVASGPDPQVHGAAGATPTVLSPRWRGARRMTPEGQSGSEYGDPYPKTPRGNP